MAKTPNIGSFRFRMAIQVMSQTRTSDGATVDLPTVFTYAWCALEPLSSREAFLAQAAQNLTTHKIRMLYQPGITPQMRGVINGRTFAFTSVIDRDEAHVELEILATEDVSQ